MEVCIFGVLTVNLSLSERPLLHQNFPLTKARFQMAG